MGLKAFHLLFIFFSGLISVVFGYWGIVRYRHTGEVTSLVLALLALFGVKVLFTYAREFVRKLHKLELS